eukprot:COSAG06_NODE_22977_length_706_cov_1.817133_1_plen_117_part_10
MLLSLLLAHHQPAEADAEAAPSMPRWVKPGSAGAGYASKKLRVPRWAPTFDMAKSTVAMPCNYSGYYDVGSLHDFGYLQFDCARTARPQLSCSPHAGAACAGTAGTHPCRIPAAVRW